MLKISLRWMTLGGLFTGGLILGGTHFAMAESNQTAPNETYYSVNIPTEIDLNPDKNSTTINISGNTYNKRWLDINVISKNDFNLKDGNNSIPYKLDKTTIEVNPQYTDKDRDSFSDTITLSKNEADTKISGNYQDQLTFSVSPVETRTISLDCNGGTYNKQSEIKYTVRNGSSYGKLPRPTGKSSDYNFYGWTDEDGNIIYSGSTVKPDTEKLIAKWVIRSYLDFDGNIDGIDQNGQSIVYFDVYIDDTKIITNSTLFNPTMTDYVGKKIIIRVNHINPNYDFLGFSYLPSSIKQYQDENGQYYLEGVLQPGKTYACCIIKTKSTFSIKKLAEQYGCSSVIFDKILPNNIASIADLSSEFLSKAVAYLVGTELHIGNPDGKVIAPSNCDKMFINSNNLINIDLSGLDTSNTTSMVSMFASCTNLKDVNPNKMDVRNVKSFASMFKGCSGLSELNLSDWNTQSLTNMNYIFTNCTNLQNIYGIGDLNISKCNELQYVFWRCSNLKTIDVKKWDVSRVKNIYSLFTECYALKEVDISGWNTKSLQRFENSFSNCTSLELIAGIENIDLSQCQTLSWLFARCSSLKKLDMSNWNVSQLQYTTNTFANTRFETLDFSSWNCNLISTANMFAGNSTLKTIYVSNNFKINAYNSMNMFYSCTSLEGGSGTTFDQTFTDATAAKIDGGPDAPGYFTYKEPSKSQSLEAPTISPIKEDKTSSEEAIQE